LGGVGRQRAISCAEFQVSFKPSARRSTPVRPPERRNATSLKDNAPPASSMRRASAYVPLHDRVRRASQDILHVPFGCGNPTTNGTAFVSTTA